MFTKTIVGGAMNALRIIPGAFNVWRRVRSIPDSFDVVKKLKLIHALGEKNMSAISNFSEAQKKHNERMESALAAVKADVESLHQKLEEFQNSPGAISPEDQALLDALQAQSEALVAKLDALDQMTPSLTDAPPVTREG